MIKIYGTLGPACCKKETLMAMFLEGMSGVRLNLSHTTLPESAPWIESLHSAAAAAGVRTSLLIDMQGPELRLGALERPLTLNKGETMQLGTEDCTPPGGATVPECVAAALQPGQQVLLDDGKILVEVVATYPDGARCRVVRGGVLHSRKSIALPGSTLRPPVLTSADLFNLSKAKAFGVTGIMQPFVRTREDLLALRESLEKVGAAELLVYAKLENKEGVENLPTFLHLADEIVIARGDLGNSMPLWELPRVQKEISALCRKEDKPFMVVTQMLASMEHAAVPTRAEVSDIFNAVLDGAHSLMVTGETAVGEYPVETIRYLCRTANG